jgi:hypothetical protein
MLATGVVDRLVEARIRSYCSRMLGWQPVERVRKRFASEVMSQLARTTDPKFGRGLMAHFPVAGVSDPRSYMDAVIALDEDRVALAGIRFRGGDPREPFCRCSSHRWRHDRPTNAASSHVALGGAIALVRPRYGPKCTVDRDRTDRA